MKVGRLRPLKNCSKCDFGIYRLGRLIHNLKIGDNIFIKVNGILMAGKVTQFGNGLYYIVSGYEILELKYGMKIWCYEVEVVASYNS